MDALLEKERIAKMMFVLRTLSKRTQTRLTKALGVSFQQIQKYEKAQNGIGADKLFVLAKEQGWDINLLYNGNPEEVLMQIPLFKQDMVAKKFREIEANIVEERKLQRIYAPLMPKLNRELAGENTFQDKELPINAPINKIA
jgi:transcriptional regulator with XRE-family HTH domain